MKILKRVGALFLVGSLCLGVVGCGDKYGDLYSEQSEDENKTTEKVAEQNDTTSNQNGQDDYSDLTETDENRFKYVVDGAGYTVTFDAEYEETSVSKASVYTVTREKYSDEDVLRIAGELFDNGEYEVIKPLELCSEQELGEIKATFEKIREEYKIDELNTIFSRGEGNIDIYAVKMLNNIDLYLENFNGEYVSSDKGPIYELDDVLCKYMFRYPDMVIYKYMTGKKGIFLGKVQGKPWIMLYQDIERYRYSDGEDENFGNDMEISMANLVAFDLTNRTILQYNSGVDLFAEGADAEAGVQTNLCDFSNMEKLDDYFKIFGLDGYEVTEFRNTFYYMPEGEREVNGYGMVFQPKIGDLEPVVWKNNPFDTPLATGYYAYASVNSEGVDYIRVNSRFKWEEAETNKQLISVDEANAKAVEFFNDKSALEYINGCFSYAGDYTKKPVVYSIKLKNVVYMDDNGKAIAAPAWVYYWKFDVETDPDMVAIAIDATNGCVIHDNYENANVISKGFDEYNMIFDGIGLSE